mgnify:CR=1 FL=1
MRAKKKNGILQSNNQYMNAFTAISKKALVINMLVPSLCSLIFFNFFSRFIILRNQMFGKNIFNLKAMQIKRNGIGCLQPF